MTTFSPSITGVVPLSNIYEIPNVVNESSTTPSSWVDTLFPTNDSDSEYDDDIMTIEGMKGGKKKKKKGGGGGGAMDDTKRIFNRVLKGIKRGVDGFSKASYYLPGKVDKGLTKLTTKATESIYNLSDRKPAKPTKKQVGMNESTLRREFDREAILTRTEQIFENIKDILDTANNNTAFKTKQNLNDDFQAFTFAIRQMDIATVKGEDIYNTLILYVQSIEEKLSELSETTNSPEFVADTDYIKTEFTKLVDPNNSLSFLKSKKDKKEKEKETFIENVNAFTKRISVYLKTHNEIIAEPYLYNYKKLSTKLKDLYYTERRKFSTKISDINTLYSNINKNSSYYVFDSEIQELYKISEEFRFEKNATAKTLEIPPDNSKLEADKRKDASILKKVIYMFMAVPFLIAATYNWYYLIVYRDNDEFADALPTSDGKAPRAVNPKNAIHWDFSAFGPLSDVVDHLFGSLIYPTRLLNRVLLEPESPIVPGFFSDKDTLLSRGGVLTMFTLIIYFMFFGVSFKELIKSDDKCKPKQNNLIVKLFMGLIMFYFVFRMMFIFFGGSHSEGIGKSFASFASNVGIKPLNFNFVPLLAKPIIAGILFILLTVGLFFIAMLSVNMSIMIVMMYLVLHSLLGFYMYLPTTSDNAHGFFLDAFLHGFSYYRNTWSKISKLFERERKEWEDLEDCRGKTAYGQFMIHVLGRIFTWLWFAITLTGIIYVSVKSRLNEMKIFGSIFIAIFGGIIMYISWNWKNILGKLFGQNTEESAKAAGTPDTKSGSDTVSGSSTMTNNPMTANNSGNMLEQMSNIPAVNNFMNEAQTKLQTILNDTNIPIPDDVKEMANKLIGQINSRDIKGVFKTINELKNSIPPELKQTLSTIPGVSAMLNSETPTDTSGLLDTIKTRVPRIAGIIDKLSGIVPKEVLDSFLKKIPNEIAQIINIIPQEQLGQLVNSIPTDKITKVLGVLEKIPDDIKGTIINETTLNKVSDIIQSNISNPQKIQTELAKLVQEIGPKIAQQFMTNPGIVLKLKSIIPELLNAMT